MVLVMIQNGAAIVHGPFDNLAAINAWAINSFPWAAGRIQLAIPLQHGTGAYTLYATTLQAPGA